MRHTNFISSRLRVLSAGRFRYSFCLPVALAGALAFTAGCGGAGGGGGGTGDGGTNGGGNGGGGTNQNLSVALSGTRGSMPLTGRFSNGGSTSTKELGLAGETVSVNSNAAVTLSVPPNYADRAFSSWMQDGTVLSSDTILTLTPSALTGTGPVTAVFTPLAMPDGGFTPSYAPKTPDFTFPHWKSFPVRVYLNSTVTPGSNNYLLILVGITRWVTASGGLINYQIVTDPTQADIQVGFGSTPVGAAGVTDTTWNGLNEMTSAVIALNPPSGSVTTVTPQNLQTIMAHEFGHALGLTGPDPDDGHSSDSNDTMYKTGNSQTGVITERDIDTIANAYPSLFDPSRATRKASAPVAGKLGADGLYHARSY